MRLTLCFLGLLSLLLIPTASLEAQSLPVLTVGDITVREGTNNTTAFLPIRVESGSSGIQFSYATVDGTAHSRTDFRAQSGSAGLSPGVTLFELSLVITGDAKAEGTESFSVRISGVRGANVTKSTGRITILDDDAAAPGNQPGFPFPRVDDPTNPSSPNGSTNNFQDLFDVHRDRHERQMAGVLDRTCGKAQGEHKRLCTFLSGLKPHKQEHMIRALIPRGMPAQGDVTLRSQQLQLKNVSARQGQLRASVRNSATRGALNQVTAELGGRSIPLDVVARALRSPTDQQALAKAINKQLAGLRKGAKQDDNTDTNGNRTLQEAGESRWGFFVNGRFGDAEHEDTVLEPGYKVDSYGGSIGVDRKLGTRGWLGAAVGYTDSTTRLNDWDYRVGLGGYSLSIYSGFQVGRFYVDGALSHGQLDFDVSRKIQLPVAFDDRLELTAAGQSDSEFSSATISTGYDIPVGARLDVSAFVRGFYSEATVDPFQETGAGSFNLTFEEQQIDSGLVEAGFELSFPISLSWGALHPILRASYLREIGDDSRQISTRFLLDSQNERFLIETDSPDRDYLSGTIGFNLTLSKSRLLYLMAERNFERDDFEQSMFLFGYRQQIP